MSALDTIGGTDDNAPLPDYRDVRLRTLRQQLAEVTKQRDELALIIATDTGSERVVADLQRQRDELLADAERYRWLCEQNEKGNGYFHLAIGARGLSGWRTKHELDDIIDRARGDTK